MRSSATSARQLLRAATADHHERVDAAFAHHDLTRREGYTAFLVAQADAFLPLEAAVEAAAPERALPDWPERRRAGQLSADLVALGVDLPPVVPAPLPLATPADVLGLVYVLEGSRLGGTMLVRSVPPTLPRTFLGAGNSQLWRSLIALLDSGLRTGEDRAAAVRSARAAFDVFERSARRANESAAIA